MKNPVYTSVKTVLTSHINNLGLNIFDKKDDKSVIVTSSKDFEKAVKSRVRDCSRFKNSPIKEYKVLYGEGSNKGLFDKDYKYTACMNVENPDTSQQLSSDSVIIRTDNLDMLYELSLILAIYHQKNSIKDVNITDYYDMKAGTKSIKPITIEYLFVQDKDIAQELKTTYDNFNDLNNLANNIFAGVYIEERLTQSESEGM